MTHPLAEILAQHPTLTAVGFESISSADLTQAEAIAERRELLESVERFEAACIWIRKHLPLSPRSRRYFSSYVLKQIAEREMGYLSNGAAMLASGHRYLRQGAHNPNAYFPLSTRRVVALGRRHRR
jgi:hypothetical protein